MEQKNQIAIIGGGLAGLTAAIHLSKMKVPVILFEKEEFPHHKVCGEYVSREILPYLEELEIPLEEELNPPEIKRLIYSTVKGSFLNADLPLGGLGISRYALDHFLHTHAIKNGAEIINESVISAEFSKDRFLVKTETGREICADIVLGSFGKRSNLDRTLDRSFFKAQAPWLAVKSHYKMDQFPKDLVALHNFKGGYCGISKTESGAVNVCYLATYKSFKEQKDPELFRENVLRKNPFLDNFFSEATENFENPLTIAQISFSPKKTVDNHILMLGDAAGLLHPLCGNGMAMAIHSAKIASEVILDHIGRDRWVREEMEQSYAARWSQNFTARIRTGKWLQKILLKDSLANFSQAMISKMPFLLPQIIKQTHGKPIK